MSAIKHECRDCHGTGLYSGMCEAEDEAVVCLGCKGTGCAIFTYKKFTGRKKKPGIKRVRHSRGTFIGTGVGGHGEHISIADFNAGKMPSR